MHLLVPALIVSAGAFGGAVSVALSGEPNFEKLRWTIVAGIGAAALVPLFLQTVSSDLLASLFAANKAPGHATELLTFGSFCLLAGITAPKFIAALSDRVLAQLKEVKQTVDKNTRELSRVNSEAAAAKGVAQAAMDAGVYGTRDQDTTQINDQVSPALAVDVKPGQVADDPWKSAFGGTAATNGRVLEAVLIPLTDEWQLVTVTLRVRSTAPDRPLTKSVQFFLHPTFAQSKPQVPVRDGVATLSLLTYGAFTVGALADDGQTRLELDLAEQPEARSPWRDR